MALKHSINDITRTAENYSESSKKIGEKIFRESQENVDKYKKHINQLCEKIQSQVPEIIQAIDVISNKTNFKVKNIIKNGDISYYDRDNHKQSPIKWGKNEPRYPYIITSATVYSRINDNYIGNSHSNTYLVTANGVGDILVGKSMVNKDTEFKTINEILNDIEKETPVYQQIELNSLSKVLESTRQTYLDYEKQIDEFLDTLSDKTDRIKKYSSITMDDLYNLHQEIAQKVEKNIKLSKNENEFFNASKEIFNNEFTNITWRDEDEFYIEYESALNSYIAVMDKENQKLQEPVSCEIKNMMGDFVRNAQKDKEIGRS